MDGRGVGELVAAADIGCKGKCTVSFCARGIFSLFLDTYRPADSFSVTVPKGPRKIPEGFDDPQ